VSESRENRPEKEASARLYLQYMTQAVDVEIKRVWVLGTNTNRLKQLYKKEEVVNEVCKNL